MEVQVDFPGIDVALKHGPLWKLFSHDGIGTESKFFILKVSLTCIHFLDSIHFLQKHSMYTLIVFSIAKGLATCRLGGCD